jgi:hypothetical protein
MSAPRSAKSGGGAIDFLEEAVHLLRMAPAGTLVVYYLGSVPFVLGFLYFWTDMSHSAFAAERQSESALVVALLFLWMKSWQAEFTRLLHDRISGLAGGRWSIRRYLRTLCIQALVQPSGLFLLPVALAVTFPFGWVFAFYQTATVLSATTEADLAAVCQRSFRQAQLWPGQNHVLLSILTLLGMFVFLDAAIVLFQGPHLLHSLLGIETNLRQSGWSLLNTTLLMTALGVTYLCVDPIVKAVYVLRCFHGQAIATGEDLAVMVRRLAKAPVAIGIVLLMATGFIVGAQGAEPLPDPQGERPLPAKPTGANPSRAGQHSIPAAGSVPAPELERAIREVISQPEYSWRLPRIKVERENNSGLLARFIDSVLETMEKWVKEGWRAVRDFIRRIIEALLRRLGQHHPTVDPGEGWITSVNMLLYAALALVVCILAVTGLRLWQRRQRDQEPVEAQPVTAVPDLTDQNLLANQLPEDAWLKLAQEMVDCGDLRLALRALYLAALAHLGHRQAVRIAKFKSNREYQRELSRRRPTEALLQAAFGELVTTFDSVWYGLREVDEAVLAHFRQHLERVTAW